MTMTSAAPKVAIWQDSWLPTPLTFIRDQTAALGRWQPVKVGLYRSPAPISEPDFAPFTPTLAGRLYRRSVGMIRQRAGYAELFADPRMRLVHAHFGYGGLNVAPLARSAGLPLLVTFHGQDISAAPYVDSAVGRRYRRSIVKLFRQADALIAVSDFIASRLVALGAPADKIVLHHIGIPRPAVQRRPDADGIVFVGRLVAKKGVADLLLAASRLPEPYRSTTIRIVGFGPLEAELRALAGQLCLSVEFLGEVSSDQVASVLSRSLVFCAPSQTAPGGDSEGLGMVNLEAAHHYLPVLGYRHGGVVEAVQDGVTGLLAAERNIEELSANLLRVLSEPDYARRLGAAGHERVASTFDIRRQTESLEQIYDRFAGSAWVARSAALRTVSSQ